MIEFNYRILDASTSYTGRELHSGWVEATTGLAGDAAAVFVGPCNVDTVDLVDLDDARAGATIVAARMLHVIIEHPGCDLRSAVLRQRLLVCILCERLRDHGVEARRDGDDVYIDERKLTVSIAAPAAESCLIHLGVNDDPAGAPVPAIGLDELGVPARPFAEALMSAYKREIESAAYVETKVREVE